MTIPFTQLAFYVGHRLELAGVIALGAARRARPAPGRRLAPRSSATSPRPTSSRRRRRSSARGSARSWCGSGRRTRRPRATRAASPCSPSRSARRSASPAAGCAASRSAASCTTWASSPCPARCCRSPARSTTPSSREIRKHPQAGVRLLRDLGGFGAGVLRLVLDHHERLDGSGYPRGLMGDELDLETRDPRRLRRLRRARLRPRLPLGLDAGARVRPAARRDPVRPGLRRGARGGARAAVRAGRRARPGRAAAAAAPRAAKRLGPEHLAAGVVPDDVEPALGVQPARRSQSATTMPSRSYSGPAITPPHVGSTITAPPRP